VASIKPLPVPGPEYKAEEERLFRESVSAQLLDIQVSLEDSQKNESIAAALAANVPSGQTEIGNISKNSYGSFNKGWGATTGLSDNITLSAINWFDVPTVWTNNLSLNMTELSGATGRFMPDIAVIPTGGSRKFLINWSMNLWYYTTATYTALAGRITKTPSGESTVEVPGSVQTSSWTNYLVYLGSYFYMKSLSGSAMVSLASADTVQFQYGFNSVSGSGTVVVVPYATYGSGLTVNITAVD
jgi:hypothetical protein